MELGPDPLPAPPPERAVKLIVGLRRLLLRLADRLLPSGLAAFEKAAGIGDAFMLREAARLGLADRLQDGPKDAATLAAELGLDADALHRVLRALVARGTFAMDDRGRFANNHVSRGLLSGTGTTRSFAAYLADRHNVLAWDRLGDTLRDGHCGFAKAYGADLWAWYEDHPDEHAMFATMMADNTVADASALATAYPWGELGRLCDVGGGVGTQLSEILVRHPSVRGVLLDSPRTLERARGLLAARGVLDRTDLVAGSFFDAAPEGCDGYLLKNVLHDWGDEPALRILGAVRRAARPGSRLVVAEALIGRHDADHPATLADVHMMMMCEGGRERSEDEMRALLARAGFRTTRVLSTPVFLGLVEAEPA